MLNEEVLITQRIKTQSMKQRDRPTKNTVSIAYLVLPVLLNKSSTLYRQQGSVLAGPEEFRKSGFCQHFDQPPTLPFPSFRFPSLLKQHSAYRFLTLAFHLIECNITAVPLGKKTSVQQKESSAMDYGGPQDTTYSPPISVRQDRPCF